MSFLRLGEIVSNIPSDTCVIQLHANRMPDLDRERLYKMLGNLADVVTIDDENIISVMRPK